jgi:hypothetical protein
MSRPCDGSIRASKLASYGWISHLLFSKKIVKGCWLSETNICAWNCMVISKVIDSVENSVCDWVLRTSSRSVVMEPHTEWRVLHSQTLPCVQIRNFKSRAVINRCFLVPYQWKSEEINILVDIFGGTDIFTLKEYFISPNRVHAVCEGVSRRGNMQP